jgi:peptidoglycan/LPS O-acetylase OafA/YrhL
MIGTYGQFHWLRWIYLYVSMGVLWRRYEPHILPRIRTLGIAGAVGFTALWLLSEPEKVALDRLSPLFAAPSALWWAQWTVLQLPLLAGVCAVAALVAVSYRIPAVAERGLAYLGTLSLGIYVTHFFFVEMWKGMPAWFLPINVAIATALAAIVTLLLGRWRVTATLLLGESWTKKSRPLGDVHTETL